MYSSFPNSSGMFISASEDKTGVLEVIDNKIAKATKIPRTHGEVTFHIIPVATRLLCKKAKGIIKNLVYFIH
jgi:prolyl 4-hydroxylase